jgi:hypothetical protein
MAKPVIFAALFREVEAAERRIVELDAGWQKTHAEAVARVSRLEAEVEVRRRESRDGAWYWQGDGEDYPESLGCPVIMSAETLRELLAKA